MQKIKVKAAHRRAGLAMAIVMMASALLLALTACSNDPPGSTAGTTAASTSAATSAATGTATTAATSATMTTSATTATTLPATSAPPATTRAARPAETTVVLKLEGKDEPVRATLHASSLGYSMYYDKALHTFGQANGSFDIAQGSRADRYQPASPVPSGTDVYLEIGRLAAASPQDALSRIRSALAARYRTVRQGDAVGIGVDKITAQVLEASDGTEQNSRLATVAVISDGKGGSFYFLNAYTQLVAQGHKARLNQMIDTFRIE